MTPRCSFIDADGYACFEVQGHDGPHRAKSGWVLKPVPAQRQPTYCHHCDNWHTGAHIALDKHEGEATS